MADAVDRPREIAMMVAHHEELQAQLAQRTTALTAAAAGGNAAGGNAATRGDAATRRDAAAGAEAAASGAATGGAATGADALAAQAALREFLSGEVIPHALAEEDTIYRAGSQVDTLAPLVAGMLMEHETLIGLAGTIDREAPGPAAAAAVAFRALFEVHVRKENELLLPGLLAAGADPAQLLATMHAAFETRRREAAGRTAAAPDTTALRAAPGETVVDTRVHTTSCANLATEAVESLAVGASFVLVADHDPRGINYMLQAERPGTTSWSVLEDGPERWQVRIARTEPAPAPTG